MKKIPQALLIFLVVLGIGIVSYFVFISKGCCGLNVGSPSANVVYKQQDIDAPSWAIPPLNGNAPWENPINIAFSNDGLSFEEGKLFVDHAGVPNVIQTADGKIIATFQYFSYTDEDLFDVIAYTVSEDYGQTWSGVTKVNFSGINEGNMKGPKPVDPTLIELEDGSFRLYFTYEQDGDGFPQLYSAKAETIGGVFENEGKQLTTQDIVLDPAVVYFKGQYHHFTTKQDQGMGSNIDNVHTVSSDGLNFERKADIRLKMMMLGDVIVDGNLLRFYGSGNGIMSATSNDGYNWTMEEGSRADGADPGVVKMENGKYLMLYTYINR